MAINNGSMESTQANLLNMSNIDTILGLSCILLMLESMSGLLKSASGINVFVCNYITCVKIY